MARPIRNAANSVNSSAAQVQRTAWKAEQFIDKLMDGKEADDEFAGRRLYRIAKGFASAAREDPDPGDLVATWKRLKALFGE